MLACAKNFDGLCAAAHKLVEQSRMQSFLDVDVCRDCLQHVLLECGRTFEASLAYTRPSNHWGLTSQSGVFAYGRSRACCGDSPLQPPFCMSPRSLDEPRHLTIHPDVQA